MQTRRNGFTLVELLVVIGIIAVLIAILLPSLAKARQAALKVACMSNMRQAVLEMRMYADENRDHIPLGYIYSDKTSSNHLWYPYSWPAQDADGKRGTHVLLGLMYFGGYMKSPMIWYCPSEWTPGLTYNAPALPPDWWNTQNLWPPERSSNNRTRSAYYCRPVAYWSTVSETRPNYCPSKDLMSFVKLQGRAVLSEGYNTTNWRHPQGVNAAYGDGSASWIPYDAYKTNLTNWANASGLTKGFYILNRPNQAQGGHSNPAWPESGVWVDYDNNH